MLIIPAIDIKGGRCVRLKQGKMETEKVFSTEPIEIVELWNSQGAKLIHIVDLEGAIKGRPINDQIIKKISNSFTNIEFQVGGGIRDIESARSYIDNGVSRVVLGTQAVIEPEFLEKLSMLHPDKVVLAVDFIENQVKTGGWLQESEFTPRKLIERFRDLPLAAIVITDISRDGMMQGPNLRSISQLSSLCTSPIIISGGISKLDDLKPIIKINHESKYEIISGVICGRALYEHSFTLKQAISLAK